tara:strand:- start:502 stop:858 length:357 start_codon:yes stop_codon:yes gene_type:complete
METKGHLIDAVKEWVKLDNEIRNIQKIQKDKKKEKEEISKSLMDIMRENEIDCFDLKDGQICYDKKTVKKPITKKTLFEVLTKYYDGNIHEANNVKDFIINNREETVKETIVRKITKQ